MMPFKLTMVNGSIDLTCDKCGYSRPLAIGSIDLETVWDIADNHKCERTDDD